ncbi:Reverse transcriptase, RNA-dependent DNA polymerase [Cinara cedri]|uniref:Reverse transcriptase, RNA-dependent DNA polymerase n=1 Tax=Cinara cedri TaxID=506608 RepID=A0A5E4N240_9HEMI|nr:Reverse transcriptase, RNA-dependent DNA polymerase [Cinara cedri]
MVGFAKSGYRLWDPKPEQFFKISEVNIREDEPEEEENYKEDESKEEENDREDQRRYHHEDRKITKLHDLKKNSSSPDKNCWKKAMQEEMDALIENNTWSQVPKPQNKRIINNKWIFKLKLDEEGNPVRYKARLVAKGYT